MFFIHEAITNASRGFREMVGKVESSIVKFSKAVDRDPNHQVRILYRELIAIAYPLGLGRANWVFTNMTNEFFFAVMPKLEALLSSLRQLLAFSCVSWVQGKVIDPCTAIERRLKRVREARRVREHEAETQRIEKALFEAMAEEDGDRDGDMTINGDSDAGESKAEEVPDCGSYRHATVDDKMDEGM